ncbi:MAG: manganese efflux pump [Ruminococcus sp.]|nr:manganese efflux pump [Ruminococcus sp.]
MWLFVFNSTLLGVGLAMDAFSVSIANGLAEPKMRRFKALAIAGTYSFFQFLMPMIGWFLVTTVIGWFKVFEKFIPYIALGLLLFIGIKMIVECLRGKEEEARTLTIPLLLLQGIATSIDALSVGFTIAEYAWTQALIASLIIGAVTFVICMFGLWIGRRFGSIFQRAEVVGGIILIAIGFEIFVKNVFFG